MIDVQVNRFEELWRQVVRLCDSADAVLAESGKPYADGRQAAEGVLLTTIHALTLEAQRGREALAAFMRTCPG